MASHHTCAGGLGFLKRSSKAGTVQNIKERNTQEHFNQVSKGGHC